MYPLQVPVHQTHHAGTQWSPLSAGVMRQQHRASMRVHGGWLLLQLKSNAFSRRTGSMMPPQSGDFPDGPTVLRRVTRPQPTCRLVSASPLEGLLTRHFTGVRREAAALGDHSAARPGRMNEGGIAQTEQRVPLLQTTPTQLGQATWDAREKRAGFRSTPPPSPCRPPPREGHRGRLRPALLARDGRTGGSTTLVI